MEKMQLSAVTLIVPDYDRAIAYYCEVLGFTLQKDIDQGHKRWVQVTPGEGASGFVLAKAEGAQQKAAIGAQGAGRVWLFCKPTTLPQPMHAWLQKGSSLKRSRATRFMERLRSLSICLETAGT